MTARLINAFEHTKKRILAVAILEINNDLERIGDLAVNIAQRAEDLSARERVDVGFVYRGMARKGERMVEKSLDALVNMDTALAREVLAMDDEVDQMNWLMFDRVQTAIREDPEGTDRYLRYLLVARNLERQSFRYEAFCATSAAN